MGAIVTQAIANIDDKTQAEGAAGNTFTVGVTWTCVSNE